MVEWEGRRVPYRLLYSQWVSEWVSKLDPKASDELLLLARGGWAACAGFWVTLNPNFNVLVVLSVETI